MTADDQTGVSTRLAAEAWEELFRAQVTLMRRFEAGDDFAPLTSREYDVLFQLSRGEGGAMRMRELTELIMLTQPSLSRMVDRLSARGLVERRAAPDDGRGVVVALTEEGAALQRQIGRNHVRSIRRYVGGALDEEELRTLQRLAHKLRTAQRDL
ncbi:MarR family winged helix-turn-helix transcriptional regulator [uncultured Georgenia sp.]|uniref:MarR family winged helix-turn-helix transcriptional regulator n=1 Tax=uncultured Georgenia sp. TaxID=378209 RepID=UPI002636C8D5|nr:MarR family winged helix-turn-helix transcriptional regulator [uncultured Georgenia sp.]HLV03862.1 MarR family winged helix-turn-helix transcriptional regulator [Actinomycetaceae bacterium]